MKLKISSAEYASWPAFNVDPHKVIKEKINNHVLRNNAVPDGVEYVETVGFRRKEDKDLNFGGERVAVELLRKRCLWAMTPKSRNSTDPETVRAVNALNDMMAARKWDAQVFLEDALIEHGVDGDAFDEWSKKKFKSVARSEENNIWCIENIAAIKDECMDQIPY